MKEQINNIFSKKQNVAVASVAFLFSLFFFAFFVVPFFTKDFYQNIAAPIVPIVPPKPRITHIKTPESVKGIYVSSWAAGTPSFMDRLVKIADETEINTLVIDIKDYTGMIAFYVKDPVLKEFGSEENRIPDIEELLIKLHEKGIYVIGRIATFQDPYMVKKMPELAVKRASDGAVWRDRKNVPWLDAGAQDVWDYMVRIGKEAYSRGFDEINYDYIRFPSDGNMRDIYYPYSKDKEKPEVIKEFFQYVGAELRAEGIPSSADLFGMTTTNTDDLNIGQVLEPALLYFDFVAPMVYPSHYPATWHGFQNPADNPYDVVYLSMKEAVRRAEVASTSPSKLRPWLQDFNLGATYDAKKIRAQIQATYDSGLNSWMMWNASNRYTNGAYLPE